MTLKLILVRHAKSLHNEYVERDIERHLSDRGYRDAADSAEWCLHKVLIPELMLSSPAIRSYSTALIFANRFSMKGDAIRLNSAIYEAGVNQLLYVLAEAGNAQPGIMLFGHNPGLTDLVNYLCGPVCSHLPTAGIALLQLQYNGGEVPPPHCGKLMELYSGRRSF